MNRVPVPKKPDPAPELRRALPWSLRAVSRRRRKPLVGVAVAVALVVGASALCLSDFAQKEIALRRLSVPLDQEFVEVYRLPLLVECGRGAAAERLARELKDPGERAEALLTVATARAKRGERRAASALIDEARAAVGGAPLRSRSTRTGVSVTGALAEAGRGDEALALARASEEPVGELAEIAAVFGSGGRIAEARELLREARASIATRGPVYQAAALCALSRVYEGLGDEGEAFALLREADRVAGTTDAGSASMARVSVAGHLAALGRYREARQVIARLAPPDVRGALLALAEAQAEAAPEEARATLRVWQERWGGPGQADSYQRARMVGSLVAIGDVDRAKEAVRREAEEDTWDFGGHAFGAAKNPAAAREFAEWMLERAARGGEGLSTRMRARYYGAAVPLLAADAPLWRVLLLHALPPAELRDLMKFEHGSYGSINETIVREYLERHDRDAHARLTARVNLWWHGDI